MLSYFLISLLMVQLLRAAEAKEPLHNYIESNIDTVSGKFLAIIYVGEDGSSAAYVQMKKRFGEKYGIETRIYGQDDDQTVDMLRDLLDTLNQDDTCGGIMIQLPLPAHLQSYAVELCAMISPSKDVDGLGGQLLGLSTIGVQDVWPATPGGIMTLLDHYGYGDLTGKRAIVLGQSNLLGKPLAISCINRGATVISANSESDRERVRNQCQQADIIFSCTGVVHLIDDTYVRDDKTQIIVDAGFGYLDGRPVGDVDVTAVSPYIKAITPIPGGVGPMTVAQLFANLITLNLSS